MDPPPEEAAQIISKKATKKKKSTPSRCHVRHTLRILAQQESAFLDRSIVARAEQERTEMAKKDVNSPVQRAINKGHTIQRHQVSLIMQQGRNTGAQLMSSLRKVTNSVLNPKEKRVRFATKRSVRVFQDQDIAAMITYDSGADGHYISESDRQQADLPILKPSTK